MAAQSLKNFFISSMTLALAVFDHAVTAEARGLPARERGLLGAGPVAPPSIAPPTAPPMAPPRG